MQRTLKFNSGSKFRQKVFRRRDGWALLSAMETMSMEKLNFCGDLRKEYRQIVEAVPKFNEGGDFKRFDRA